MGTHSGVRTGFKRKKIGRDCAFPNPCIFFVQVAARGHTPKHMRARSIGLQVLRVELDTLGRRWEVTPGSLLLEVPLCKGRELSASFRADPGVAYVLVPYPG